MATHSPIRILLGDDHEVVRLGLRSLLGTQPDLEVVGEAADGAEAVAAHERLQPDITLLDLRMPVLNGLEATRAIRAREATARIMILTTYAGEEDIYQALQAGARAYFLKSAPSAALLEAIRAVRAGQIRMPPEVAERLAHRLSAPELSPREREVLQAVARGRSNKEIARELGVAENTIKNHVKLILDKLGVQDRTQATLAAVQRGLVHLD